MPRILQMTRVLRILVWLGIVLLLAMPATRSWLAPTLLVDRLAAMDLGQARLVAFLLQFPPYGLLAWGLGQVLTFCRRIEEKRLFTAEAANALRRFGLALLLSSMVLLCLRLGLAISDLLPFDFARGVPGVVIPVAVGVTFGLVFMVFAAILGEAARLAEENAAFV
ncbi:MAG: DUF2975 domain-containing protein [Magnetospirillum sp.]|nr:DUF2975 domain-containing protein [Magnetospirillum sp.]